MSSQQKDDSADECAFYYVSTGRLTDERKSSSTLSTSFILPLQCSQCGKQVENSKSLCPCKRARYCSTECQKTHLHIHKKLCTARMSDRIVPDDVKKITIVHEKIYCTRPGEDLLRNPKTLQVIEWHTLTLHPCTNDNCTHHEKNYNRGRKINKGIQIHTSTYMLN